MLPFKNLIPGVVILVGILLSLPYLYQAGNINSYSLRQLYSVQKMELLDLSSVPETHPRSTYWQAQRAMGDSEYGTALALLQPLADQGDRYAQQLLGQIYKANGELTKAVKMWQQTGNGEALTRLAESANENGDLERASEAYYAAWELDRSQGTSDLVRFLRREMKDPAAAERVLWQSLPDVPVSLLHYGWLTQLARTLEEQERWADAAKVYERSLELGKLYGQPTIEFYDYMDLHRVNYHLAAAYQNSEQTAQAIGSIEEAILMDPANVSYLLRGGEIYEASGENDKALAMYGQLLVLQSDHAKALEAVARLSGE